jgi:catechol-2,3-dioxygenase
MVNIGAIILNVSDRHRASEFWSQALGYQPDWVYPAGADFVVLADTEGNLFCVIGD